MRWAFSASASRWCLYHFSLWHYSSCNCLYGLEWARLHRSRRTLCFDDGQRSSIRWIQLCFLYLRYTWHPGSSDTCLVPYHPSIYYSWTPCLSHTTCSTDPSSHIAHSPGPHTACHLYRLSASVASTSLLHLFQLLQYLSLISKLWRHSLFFLHGVSFGVCQFIGTPLSVCLAIVF